MSEKFDKQIEQVVGRLINNRSLRNYLDGDEIPSHSRNYNFAKHHALALLLDEYNLLLIMQTSVHGPKIDTRNIRRLIRRVVARIDRNSPGSPHPCFGCGCGHGLAVIDY